MVLKNIRPVFIGVAVFISGCSFSAESLLPTLTGEDPAGPTSSAQNNQAPEARTSPAPPLAPTRLAQNAPANNVEKFQIVSIVLISFLKNFQRNQPLYMQRLNYRFML